MTFGGTKLKYVIGVVVASVIPASALAVPVVPNFTQGSMTSHTETTSKVTETINSIDYNTGWQYSVTGTNVNNGGARLNPSNVTNNVMVNPLGGLEGQVSDNKYVGRPGVSKIYNNGSERSVSIHSNLFGSRNVESNNYSKSNRSHKRYRYHKCLYPIIALLVATPVKANVGGVSATANPIANSSGSVTNQAIQVLQGPYVTNTYGGGIFCQGPTANITPFVTQ